MSTRSNALLALAALVIGTGIQSAADSASFELKAKIPLADVHGRIDHLAVDVARQRLYVAELGNDSVGVIDLKENKVLRTLTGFAEPQGIAYEASTDQVFVANARDATVRVLNAADLSVIGSIKLGSDADNVRVDNGTHRVYVGYGSGALAVIDPTTRNKIADIPLKGHPESFQLEPNGLRIFVNVPDTREVAVVDRVQNRQTASWPQKEFRSNYPLALDSDHQRVIAVFRHPATFAVFALKDGALLQNIETCSDSDDVFIDKQRNRVYVVCGEGVVETFASLNDKFARADKLPTVSGARTGLYVADLDRLYVAVRATLGLPASIWVLRPQ
jgi:YVTN family beta-propeller protein